MGTTQQIHSTPRPLREGSGRLLMTPEDLWAMGRMGAVSMKADGSQCVYAVSYYSVEKNNSRSVIFCKDMRSGQAVQLTAADKSESSATYLPDGRIAFLSGGEVWMMAADGTGRQQITHTDGNVGDFLFSPDATKLICVQEVKQHTAIAEKEPDLPLASGMVINDLMYKHWDHYVTAAPHPFLYTIKEGTATFVCDILEGEPYECPMEPFGGVEQLAWSPDGKQIAYTCRKKTGRDYAVSTDSDIFLWTVEAAMEGADGQMCHEVVNLCKGQDYEDIPQDYTRSLEQQQVNAGPKGNISGYGHRALFAGYDDNPAFSPDGKYIAFRSMERDGYESDRTRLCVMELATGKYTFVTEDLGEGRQSGVEDYLWSPDSKLLYFTAVWHGRTNIYVADLQGNVKQLTDDVCDYSLCDYVPARDKKGVPALIVKRHSLSQADEAYFIEVNTNKKNLVAKMTAVPAQQFTHINAATYARLAFGEVKERWTKTTDGKEMLSWVVYPPHFDPAKKYPTLLFCEGGPQSPVSQFWSYRWNLQIMAAHGYIVVAPNRRGLPGFGMEWLEEISGDYTGQCMQDLLAAIDDVANEPYVDKDRLGAVGASFGGFSVYWLAGNHDKRFKAFIAHDGIYNTLQQYVETEEMWFPNWDMGAAPWYKNAEGQMQKAFETSPHLYVQNWDTPILCIHGQKDFRIEYTHAESAFNAARLRGLDAQLLLFPDENHWVLKPQNGILWQRTFFRFLDKYLK